MLRDLGQPLVDDVALNWPAGELHGSGAACAAGATVAVEAAALIRPPARIPTGPRRTGEAVTVIGLLLSSLGCAYCRR